MTFPLEFDLLMIGVCTFIQKKKKQKKKTKTKKQKKNKKNKKKSAKICLCLISTPSKFLFFFVIGFISRGLSELFMRDELRESSLRSFVPWIMTDMIVE